MSAFYDQASLVVVPSGYKSGKIYAQKPLTTDGQLTFTRASTATRVNASGLIEAVASGVPRLDYTDSTCPKLLLEPQRVNSILQSENWSLSWSLLRVTNSANSTTSPDGTASADQLLDTAVAGTHVAIQTITKAASPVAYTASIYLKASVRTLGELRLSDQAGNGARNTFNLASGTIGTPAAFGTGFTAITSTMTAAGNGWYRMTLTATTNSSVTLGHEIYMANDSANTSYTGDGSGFFVWGAQLEAGEYATSYVKTEAAAVTRLADAASKTGISSLIGQTEGTAFADLTITKPTSGNADFLLLENAATPTDGVYVLFMQPSGQLGYFSYPSGAFGLISGVNYSGQRIKVAYAYSSAGFVVYINGSQVFSNGSVTLGTGLSTLGINNPVTKTLDAKVAQALLFKTRLTNAQLAELTTL
jgi:hypothetical protein